MGILELTDEKFSATLQASKTPVLVDFWATWCAPCRAVAPVLEALSHEYEGSLVIAKVDVDKCPKTAAAFRIQSIPTLLLFRNGRAVEAVQGALPRERLTALLETWVPELLGPSIGADELAKALASRQHVIIIDVRPESDYARSHLGGAEHVDPEALEVRLGQLLDDPLVVLVCRTGADSVRLAKRLAKMGRVFALRDGLLAWEGSGHPTFSSREEAELARRPS